MSTIGNQLLLTVKQTEILTCNMCKSASSHTGIRTLLWYRFYRQKGRAGSDLTNDNLKKQFLILLCYLLVMHTILKQPVTTFFPHV